MPEVSTAATATAAAPAGAGRGGGRGGGGSCCVQPAGGGDARLDQHRHRAGKQITFPHSCGSGSAWIHIHFPFWILNADSEGKIGE